MGNALATHTEPSAKLTTAHKAHHCDGHAPTQTRDYIIDSRRGGSPGGGGGGGGAAVAVAEEKPEAKAERRHATIDRRFSTINASRRTG